MPDVESQLRRYFDSSVERIDADDVLAGVRVTNQLQRWDARARHPLRVATAAAALMTVAIGAVVVGAWALGRGGSRIGEAATTPTAAQPFDTIVWPISLIAAGVAIAAVVALMMKRRKGNFMDTLERETPDVRIEHLRKSNRGLIVALVVALLALAGLGGWMLFDNVIDTGIEADINALLDEYRDAVDAGDYESMAALFAPRGVFIDGDGDIIPADELADWYEMTESSTGAFAVETLGDTVILEDPDTNRYYAAVPSQIGFGLDPYFKGFSTYVLSETTDGELRIISHQWSPHNNYR